MSIISKKKDMNINNLPKKKIENEMYQRNSKSKLNEILKNSNLRAAFYDFLRSQFCVENLLCWEAIEKYKSKNGTASEMYTMAEEIYKKFIKDNSKYEINIYSKQKDLLKEKLKKTFILPQNINKTETFPKRKTKKKYWTDVILPALKSSTSHSSSNNSNSNGGTTTTFSNISTNNNIINNSNHLSISHSNSNIITAANSHVSSTNNNSNNSSNSNNSQNSSTSIVSPKFFHSPRLSRATIGGASSTSNSSPQHSPYGSPFCSPNHSPTSNSCCNQECTTTINSYSSGGYFTNYEVGGHLYHSNINNNTSFNGNTSGRKSMIVNGSTSFTCSDDSDINDFDDLFNDDSIDIEEVKFGTLSSAYLFNDIQDELEQMMIENSLGEFLKSKIYLERAQGNSLP